ncbi:MAG: isopenicillin N synthase family oxygenase [Bdellovibrionales bacterium]|nr:isopenicillin N synthase family oxygenase [Bdellovibrionales bacterium]
MEVLKVKYGSNEAAERFCHSLKTTGFAVLTAHPIPTDLVSRVYKQWGEFFAGQEKHKYTFKPESQAGYFPFRSENAKDYSIKDLKEFFHIYPRSEMPEFLKQDTWDLYNRLVNLGEELLKWVQNASPADVKKHFSIPLQDMIQDSDENLLRMIHYPPIQGNEEKGAIRAAAHEDINLITLLCSATAAGLEVMDTAGNWHVVPCDPGSIAINAGDMLQMASQGYYKSTTHRVMNPTGPESKLPRYSMPLFLHPRSEVKLSPEVTAGQYLRQRLLEIGLLKK